MFDLYKWQNIGKVCAQHTKSDNYLETKAGSMAVLALTWKQIQVEVADQFATRLVGDTILQTQQSLMSC